MFERLQRALFGLVIAVFIVFGLQFVAVPLLQEIVEPDLQSAVLPETNFERGQYYFNQGDNSGGAYDLKKARYYYELEAAHHGEENSLVWYQLGRIDFLEGKYAAALNNFDTQQARFGDDVYNVYYMIGLTRAYAAKDNDRVGSWVLAENAFRTFLQYEPDSPWAATDLAWIYFEQGKFQDMYMLLHTRVEAHQDHPWLLNMYGLALYNLGQQEAAYEYFAQADALVRSFEVVDWGSAYPGNNPRYWHEGLEEFREAIQYNLMGEE